MPHEPVHREAANVPCRRDALLALARSGPTRVVDVVIFPLEVQNAPRILDTNVKDADTWRDAGCVEGALAC